MMFAVESFRLLLLVSLFPLAQGTPVPPGQGIPPIVWELVTLTGADGVPAEIEDPTRYTVQFQPDGRFAAKLDCNQGFGGYTAVDGVLELTDMGTTLALCEPDSHGDAYLIVLGDATSYELDPDGFLVLSGDGGTLRFRPA
jgi:heat shock protein HslJ